jgi:hypothetical protein
MSMETKRPADPHGDPHGAGGPGYEKSDASIPGMLKSGLVLAFVLFISFVGMKWTLDYFQKSQPLGPPASEVKTPPVPEQGPMLQVQPHQELVDYCNRLEQQLNSYGWIDQSSGVVRIPVSRAMELTLERGLPIRAANAAPAGSSGAHQVGTVEAPLAQGSGGPCGYIYGHTQAQQKEREAQEEIEKSLKD